MNCDDFINNLCNDPCYDPCCDPCCNPCCNQFCDPSCSPCIPKKKENNGYDIIKNTANITLNNNQVISTNQTSTMVYNPSLTILGCYDCCCRKFIKCGCLHHCHYYYSEFTICNENEFFLHNAVIHIGTSSGLQYMKNTLKINNQKADDTKTIILEKIGPHEVVTISFCSCAEIINNCSPTFIEEFKFNCSYLGFSNIPKYFNEKKYMIIK